MYKSKDQVYLKQHYDEIMRVYPATIANVVWNTFYKSTCIEDLYYYMRSISTDPVPYYKGPVNSKVVFIFIDNDDTSENFIRTVLRKLGYNPNNYFMTYLNKNNQSINGFDMVLRELGILKPECIFFVGSMTDLSNEDLVRSTFASSEVHLVAHDDIVRMEALKAAKTESEELNLLKQTIWKEFSPILRYLIKEV